MPGLVGPTYLAPDVLPSAADIFYHKSLIYSLPTGFHPTELTNVYSFPEYCRKKGVSLPRIYWYFCSEYFLNSKLTYDCLEVLEPLRKSGNITITQLIYGRDIKAISNAAELIERNLDIINLIDKCPLSTPFIAREFLSHVLYKVYLEKGSTFDGVVDYLQQYQSKEQILKLIYTVLVNRFSLFADPRLGASVLVFHPNYVNLLSELYLQISGKSLERTEEERINVFTYALFNRLVHPIYGICDNSKKNSMVAKICKEKASEIDQLIEECRFIASDIVFLPTKDDKVKKERLAKLIKDRITEPMVELCEKEKSEINQMLIEFVTESGIIAALLSCLSTPSLENVLLSVTAAGASTLLRLFITPRVQPELPSKFLITSLRKMRRKESLYLTKFNEVLSIIDSEQV